MPTRYTTGTVVYWNGDADLNFDYTVDGQDLALLASTFGNGCL